MKPMRNRAMQFVATHPWQFALQVIKAFRKNDRLDARGAPLDDGDCDDVRELRQRGVTVLVDPACE